MMKRFLMRLLAFALGIAFIALALAPVAVRQWRRWRDAHIAREYLDAAGALDTLECGTLLAAARSYNDSHGSGPLADPFAGEVDGEANADYGELLNPAGNGVMAVLEVPKLGAVLPVYHGTRDAALGAGVGHVEDTDLPVGGTGTRCALIARRGGWFAGPFAGLDRLIAGDCFYIHTLQDTLVYEVVQEQTLAPEALAETAYDPRADECLLMTTTPYREDTQRLLVRATRVSRRATPLADDSRALPEWESRLIFAVPVAAAGLLLLALLDRLARALRRRRIKRMKL